MNSMSHSDMFDSKTHMEPTRRNKPVVVQILTVIAFGVFSIVATALAFAAFWVAGLIITAIIAATWAGMLATGKGKRHKQHMEAAFDHIRPHMAAPEKTGNASFDAYRDETIQRLEEERRDFEAFLTRLRDARDAEEFSQFMDDRVRQTKTINPDEPVHV